MSEIMAELIQSLLERFETLEAQARQAQRLQETVAKLAHEVEILKVKDEIKYLKEENEDRKDAIRHLKNKYDHLEKSIAKLSEDITGNPTSRSLSKKRKRDAAQMVNQELLADEDSEIEPKKRRVTKDG